MIKRLKIHQILFHTNSSHVVMNLEIDRMYVGREE